MNNISLRVENLSGVKQSVGSGISLSDGALATAKHVVADDRTGQPSQNLKVGVFAGKERIGSIPVTPKVSDTMDLAKLTPKQGFILPNQAKPLATKPPETGKEVFTHKTFAGGKPQDDKLAKVLFDQRHQIEFEQSKEQPKITFGDSGGMILNEAGKVVGMVSAGKFSPQDTAKQYGTIVGLNMTSPVVKEELKRLSI